MEIEKFHAITNIHVIFFVKLLVSRYYPVLSFDRNVIFWDRIGFLRFQERLLIYELKFCDQFCDQIVNQTAKVILKLSSISNNDEQNRIIISFPTRQKFRTLFYWKCAEGRVKLSAQYCRILFRLKLTT